MQLTVGIFQGKSHELLSWIKLLSLNHKVLMKCFPTCCYHRARRSVVRMIHSEANEPLDPAHVVVHKV